MKHLLKEFKDEKYNYKSVDEQFKEEIKEYLDGVNRERKLWFIESLENFLMLERLKL